MSQLHCEVFPDGFVVRGKKIGVELSDEDGYILLMLEQDFPNGKYYECNIDSGDGRSIVFIVPMLLTGKLIAEISYVFAFVHASPGNPNPKNISRFDPCFINDHRGLNGQLLSDELALMAAHWTVVR